MDEIKFALSHCSFIVVLLILSFIYGKRLTESLKFQSGLEEACFSIALGLGVISYLIYLLGLLGLIYRSVVASVLICAALLCYRVWIRWPAEIRVWLSRARYVQPKRVILYTILAVVSVALALPFLQMPLYPPTAFDSIMYHLPWARVFVESHAVVFTPFLRFAVLPQTNQMLFTLALLFYDDIIAQMVQFSLLVLTGTALVAFGKRTFSARAGWWAVALLLSNPLVLWLGSSAYIEAGLILYVLMGVYAAWNWSSTKERGWILLSGVFCGLAISIKYPAMFFFAALALFVFFRNLKDKKFIDLLIFLSVTVLVLAPWLARNFYYTRNPFFPFFHKIFSPIFGVGMWDLENYETLFGDSHLYGIGKGLSSLLRLPWDLAFNQTAFYTEAPISEVFVFLLPVIVAGCILSRPIRFIAAVSIGFLLFWFFSIQAMRFLVPCFAILALAVAASIDRILVMRESVKRWTSHPVFGVLVFALLIYPGWSYAGLIVRASGPVPTTREKRDEYLIARLPSYPAYQLLNEQGKKNYRIYSYQDEHMNYYASGLVMGDYFGPARYSLIMPHIESGKSFYEALKSFGADYFLVNHQRSRLPLPQDEFFKRNFKLVYSKGDVLLFDLTDQPIRRDFGPQLINNPGFEELSGGWPSGWGRAGNPVVDGSGTRSFNGSVAVNCKGADNVFFQVVQVNPGIIYSLGYTGRSEQTGQPARLQVNWLDVEGGFIKADLQIVSMSTEWGRFETSFKAPERAARGVVYAACHDTGSGWFDEFLFAEVKVQPGR